MKERNPSQIRRTFGIIMSTLLLFVFATAILISLIRYQPLYPVQTLDTGWTASFSGNTVKNTSAGSVMRAVSENALPYGGTIRMQTTLHAAASDIPSPSLRLDYYYMAVEVLLDGKLVAACQTDKLERGTYLNSEYVFVPIPADYDGKELTILYHYDDSGADFCFFDPVFGAQRDVYRLHLSRFAYPLFTGIFLVVFGVFFLVVSLFFSALVPEIKGQIVSAVLSLDMGLWVISMSRLSALFMVNNHTTTIEYTTYYAFVPLLYILLKQIHEIRRVRLFRIWVWCNIAVLAGMVFLHVAGILHITRLRIIFYLLCFTVLGLLLAYDIYGIRNRNTSILNILQMAGPTSFTLLAGVAGMLYMFTGFTRNLPPGELSRTLFITGCLSFVLIRFVIYLLLLMEAQGNRLEFDSLTRMANIDPLTGLYNRNYSTDLLQTLNDTRRDYCLVSMDLNHLKYVNDTFGHGKGDALLIDFSAALKEAFPEAAACCRVGGDEFMIFVESRGEEQIASYIRKVTDTFSALNKTEPMIPHSVAWGYAFKHELPEETAHGVYMLADQRMYSNKQTQKLEEGLVYVDEGTNLLPAIDPRHDIDAGDPRAPRMDDIRRRKLDATFAALSSTAEGSSVFLCDMKYDYSRWSRAVIDFFDMPGEYMYHAFEIWEEHLHPDDREAFRQNIDALFSGGREGLDMQYRALSKDGKYVVCTNRGVVIKDEKGSPEYFAGSIRNHGLQSHIDPITGLRNQYGFTDDITELINSKIPARIMIVGIAQFNQINDVYGYTFGSRVLSKVGRLIIESAGNTGAIYRMDGARFTIVNRDYNDDEMAKIYRLLQNILKKDFAVDGKRQHLVLNGGLLTLDNFRISATTVTSCLNYAINESATKRNGDLVFFRQELADANRERLEKLNVIRNCISDGFRGFYLCYQYLVDAHTEQVIGAEALLRWKNDYYGNVPPGEFVPVLEQDPLFPELGSWIMKQAMTDGKRFLEVYPDFIMNVNLSYSQLEKFDFVNVVGETINETGFPSDHLCLEVTESCRVLDTDMLSNIITSLKALGVRFALDDFGTGFSSLSILKRIDFDVVKIDREFVLGIEDDPHPARTIEAIAALAANYGAAVCVEGVETRDACDILRRFAVKSFQGYFFAKPTPIEDLLT